MKKNSVQRNGHEGGSVCSLSAGRNHFNAEEPPGWIRNRFLRAGRAASGSGRLKQPGEKSRASGPAGDGGHQHLVRERASGPLGSLAKLQQARAASTCFPAGLGAPSGEECQHCELFLLLRISLHLHFVAALPCGPIRTIANTQARSARNPVKRQEARTGNVSSRRSSGPHPRPSRSAAA